MNRYLRNKLNIFVTLACIIGFPALIARGCNYLINDQIFVGHSYKTNSFSTGISSHTEYTKYSDGSRDVKIYPIFGGISNSELRQDIDGDGIVDRIRGSGAGWKGHKFTELLIRKDDYQSNKERFNEADKHLSDLIRQYD